MAAAETATALKQKGNKAFAAHDWLTAVEFYTQAIEANEKDPSFYSNRAQVHEDTTSFYSKSANPTFRPTSNSNHMATQSQTPRKP